MAHNSPLRLGPKKKIKFKNSILNQLIVLWQLRQALLWTPIEDEYLHAAFSYANPEANLFGRKWSAQSAKKLYLSLKQHVFLDLKVSFFCNIDQV